MTTERSEQAPIQLGCLLEIYRGNATGFSLICIENEWLGNPHSFVKMSGGRSMTLFACHFARGVLRAQLFSWRAACEEQQHILSKISSKTTRRRLACVPANIVKKVTGQVQLGKGRVACGAGT